MTWMKTYGNKKDQAEVIGEYGRSSGQGRTSTDRKAGRMGRKPEPKQRTDRQAEKPLDDGQETKA